MKEGRSGKAGDHGSIKQKHKRGTLSSGRPRTGPALQHGESSASFQSWSKGGTVGKGQRSVWRIKGLQQPDEQRWTNGPAVEKGHRSIWRIKGLRQQDDMAGDGRKGREMKKMMQDGRVYETRGFKRKQQQQEQLVEELQCPYLPDEVLQLVLAKLPLLQLFRLRSVCKAWKALISFPLFASFHAQSPPTNYLLVYHRRKLKFFNHDTHKWHTFSPPFRFPHHDKDACILPSAEGLLCFELKISGTWIIRVWNLITNAWRDLPPLPNRDKIFCTHTVHSYTSQDRKTFFIWKAVIWANADKETVFMYDSSKNVWIRVENAVGFNWSSIYRNMGRSFHFMKEKGLAVLLLDPPLDSDILWSETQLKPLPIFQDGHLLHCGGRVLAACWLGHDDNRSMEIWEFDRQEKEGRLSDYMPNNMVKALNSKWVQCLAGNNSLFFIGGESLVVSIYDMSEKPPRWKWLPKWKWLTTAALNNDHIHLFPASLNACNL